MDGTHIKTNANINKKIKKVIPATARAYGELLMKEVNEDREAHGKKPFDGGNVHDSAAFDSLYEKVTERFP